MTSRGGAARRAASEAWRRVDGWRRKATSTPALSQLVAEGVVSMDRCSYGNPVVHVWRKTDGVPFGGRVRVGSFVSIGDDVHIYTGGNHRPDWVSTFPFHNMLDLPGVDDYGLPASKGDVVVGNDVWLGEGAVLLSGTTIGHGAVVGARAVVAGDVRPYAIVVGNPAQEVRRRFGDARVDALLALEWWSWPLDRILSQVDLLCSTDVDGFLRGNPGDGCRDDLR